MRPRPAAVRDVPDRHRDAPRPQLRVRRAALGRPELPQVHRPLRVGGRLRAWAVAVLVPREPRPPAGGDEVRRRGTGAGARTRHPLPRPPPAGDAVPLPGPGARPPECRGPGGSRRRRRRPGPPAVADPVGPAVAGGAGRGVHDGVALAAVRRGRRAAVRRRPGGGPGIHPEPHPADSRRPSTRTCPVLGLAADGRCRLRGARLGARTRGRALPRPRQLRGGRVPARPHGKLARDGARGAAHGSGLAGGGRRRSGDARSSWPASSCSRARACWCGWRRRVARPRCCEVARSSHGPRARPEAPSRQAARWGFRVSRR